MSENQELQRDNDHPQFIQAVFKNPSNIKYEVEPGIDILTYRESSKTEVIPLHKRKRFGNKRKHDLEVDRDDWEKMENQRFEKPQMEIPDLSMFQTEMTVVDTNIIKKEPTEQKRPKIQIEEDVIEVKDEKYKESIISSHSSAYQNKKKRMEAAQNSIPTPRQVNDMLHAIAFEHAEDDKLSYLQLQNHIRQNHPKKNNTENWDLMQSTGSLFNFKAQRKIPKVLKDVGLGASLYLLTLKTFRNLFLVITILNIPIYMLFASGTEFMRGYDGLTALFGPLSLGNIGQAGPNCVVQNFALNLKQITLKCSSGTLVNWNSIGMSSYQNQQCHADIFNYTTTIFKIKDSNEYKILDGYIDLFDNSPRYFKTFIEMNSKCSTFLNENLTNSKFVKQLEEKFDAKCRNKPSCTLDYDYMDLDGDCLNEVIGRASKSWNPNLYNDYHKRRGQDPKDYKFDEEVPEPNFFFVTQCDSNSINILRDEKYVLQKEYIAYLIVGTDILITTVLIIAYNLIMYMQREYVQSYDEQTVEARDFTIEIKNLPDDFRKYKSEIDMKFAIWNELQEAIKVANQVQFFNDQTDPTIISINIALKDNKLYDHLREIQKVVDKLDILELEFKKSKSDSKKTHKNREIDLFTKMLKNMLLDHSNLERTIQNKAENSDDSDILNEDVNSDISEEEIKTNKKDKSLYIDKIERIFVTFLSMDTNDKIKQLFSPRKESSRRRCCLNILADQGCLSKQLREKKTLIDMKQAQWKNIMTSLSKPQLNSNFNNKRSSYITNSKSKHLSILSSERLSKKVDELQIKVNNTCDPEFILWHNLGVNSRTRIINKCRSVIIMIFIVLMTFIIIAMFKTYRSGIYKEILPLMENSGPKGLSCSSLNPTQDVAYVSMLQLEQKNQISKERQFGRTSVEMYCYCQQNMLKDPFNFYDEVFTNGKKYCDEWWQEFKLIQIFNLVPSLIIQFINVLSSFLFIYLAKKEGQPIKSIENASIFQLIFIQMFISVGVVQVWAEAQFNGFDTIWYMTVGVNLCFALVISIIASKLSELVFQLLIDWIKRSFDRNFSSSMTREPTNIELEQNTLQDFKHHRYQKTISSDVLKVPEIHIERTIKDDFLEKDKIPNTKKIRQKDLEELYTGPQIQAGEKFAQMYNALTITMTYSTGLPLMYFILMLYYHFAYWFNKIMLMRYYQRTYEFNENLTINSIGFFKYAIFIHMCTSVWKLSNQSLLQISSTSTEHFKYYTDINQIETQSFFQLHTIVQVSYYGLIVVLYLFNQWVYMFSDSTTSKCVSCISCLVCERRRKRKKPLQKQSSKFNLKKKAGQEFEGGDLDDLNLQIQRVKDKHAPKIQNVSFDEFRDKMQNKYKDKQRVPSNAYSTRVDEENEEDVLDLAEKILSSTKNSQQVNKKDKTERLQGLQLSNILNKIPGKQPIDNLKIQKKSTTPKEAQKSPTKKKPITLDENKSDSSSINLSEIEKSLREPYNESKSTKKLETLAKAIKTPETDDFDDGDESSDIFADPSSWNDVKQNQILQSSNYYAEVLFDFLELFYKKALQAQASTYKRMLQLKKRAEKGIISQDAVSKFEEYYLSIVKRKNLIEDQIDLYYKKVTKYELEKTLVSMKTGRVNDQIKGIKESKIKYIERIQHLNEFYDENDLHNTDFPDNFRCKSFVQSYDILHSHNYFNADLSLLRANYLVKNRKFNLSLHESILGQW